MKLIAPLALVALIAITALSCSKEESVDTGGRSKNRLKTYTKSYSVPGVGQYSETFNVFYDDQDRIIRLQSTTTPTSKFEYTYSGDHFVLEIFKAGELVIHNTSYLNNLSLIDSCFQYNNEGDSMITKYVYNSNKQLVQERWYDYTKLMGPDLSEMINYTYDTNGLLTKTTNADSETTYKYDKVIVNNVHVGAPYMPIPVRLPTQTVTTYGIDSETVDYTYNFDSSERLVNELSVSSEGIVITKTYTYY